MFADLNSSTSRLSTNNVSLYSSTAFPFAPFISQQSALKMFLITIYFLAQAVLRAQHMCLGGVTL